jgi:hypothetical protein
MNSHEAFKIGFLCRCADEGLTPEQTAVRIKQAATLPKQAGFNPLTWGKPVGSGIDWLWQRAKVPMVAGPPALGVLGGYALSKAKADTFDVDEAKRDEELTEYQRAIDQLARSQRLNAVR